MTAEVSPYLFVYGTLRRNSGHPMSQYLADRARFLGAAQAPGRLYHLGPFPGMLDPAGPEDWVEGELYELHTPQETLAALDRYEDCPTEESARGLFERCLRTVEMARGRRVTAWVYLYGEAIPEEQRIISGDYLSQSPHNGD
jgi:gamma-glutamylcyclotransferase (GGCT)/AIG2-like uncharacterized protein YtfP